MPLQFGVFLICESLSVFIGLSVTMPHGRSKNSSNSSSSNTGHSTSTLLALVEWLGDHVGERYTHNVDTTWIKDFDPLQPLSEESYVIDWRVPPKPRAGYPVWDGKVLLTSESEDFLKRRKQELLRLPLTPHRPMTSEGNIFYFA